MPTRRGRKSASQTPSPLKDRIHGSKVNPKGSASSEKSASKIKLDAKTILALNLKLKEFKKTHSTDKVSLNDLKAVYRRGLGAYSSSHRPTISGGKPNTRNAWAMARVNKFLLKASGGKVKEAYVQDDDLLKMHLGGDMSKHLAPNGKPSKLTHEQWHMVRTPEFKAWFGDWEKDPKNASKVVDENGEPLVVYHGQPKFYYGYDENNKWKQYQNAKINVFDKSLRKRFTHAEIGFYFGDKENAKIYADYNGYVYEVFLKIINPLINNDGVDFNIKGKILNSNRIDKNDYDLLLQNNIDGLISFLNYGNYSRLNELVVFEPNQIKLADGTNTTFDGGNPDIRYADGGLVKGRLYAIKGKFNNKNRFIEEVTYLKGNNKSVSFSKLSNDGKVMEILVGTPKEIKIYKRVQGEWTEIINPNFDEDNEQYAEGGVVKSFYEWYIDWYKKILNEMTIMISLPNDLQPFKEKNVVIINKFKKEKESIKAYKYLQQMLNKADEFGITIYLKPTPIGNVKTKSELIDYYEKFGFELTPNKDFMKRLPKYSNGGNVKTDFNEYQNEGFRKAVLSMWHDFSDGYISEYLDVEKENYVLTDHDNMMVIFRNGENFTDVEKAKIENWIEPYLDQYKKPQIAKYIFGYEINGNKIMIKTNPKESFKDGGTINKMHLGGDMSKHLAPNGKPSNLTHEQWHMVRTPQFKAWFGDWENNPEDSSKVVDENGEPLVVYRGIRTMTDYTKEGLQYFATEYGYAKAFSRINGGIGNVLSVFLNIRNPLKFEQYNKVLKKVYGLVAFNGDGLLQVSDELENKNPYINQIVTMFTTDGAEEIATKFKNEIESCDGFEGYDAGNYGEFYVYVTKESNQIKLADGTNTTFDGGNPDIRYANGGEVIYSAIFFDVDKMLNAYGQVHPNLFSHHSTIEFKPKDISHLPIGEEVMVEVVGRLTTPKVDALIVKNPFSENDFPHITLSTAIGVKPFETNNEIKNNLDKIEPFNDELYGIVGYFDGKSDITTFSKGGKVGSKRYWNGYKYKGLYIVKFEGEQWSYWNIWKDEYATDEVAIGFNTKRDAMDWIDRNQEKYDDGGEVDYDEAIKQFRIAYPIVEDERYLTSNERRSIGIKSYHARKRLEKVLGFDMGNLPSLTDKQRRIREEVYERLRESRRYDDGGDVDYYYTLSEFIINKGLLQKDKRYIFSHDKEIKFIDADQFGLPSMKPKGLWYGIGDDWANFLTINMHDRASRQNNLHEIEVSDKVLKLNTIEEAIDFTKKYGVKSNFGTNINWDEVSQDWSGIEIANPYEWSRVGDYENGIFYWMYIWDVPSGCVWQKDGIKSIRPMITNFGYKDGKQTWDINDFKFKDGGVTDIYTKKEIKKAYVSIRIKSDSERKPDSKFSYEYQIKSIDLKPFQELAEGYLDGILGVSTSVHNVADWFSHRECLVVMPFDKFVEYNETEQIRYDDLASLTKNGLDVFFRLFDRKGRGDREYDDVLANIFARISRELDIDSKVSPIANKLEYASELFNTFNRREFREYFAKQPRVNSPLDFAKITKEYINSGQAEKDGYYFRSVSEIDYSDVLPSIERGILASASAYKDESEWLILNKRLYIPEGSQLFFSLSGYENLQSKYEELIDDFNLRKKYSVYFVNNQDVERFRQIKYKEKDKIFQEQLSEAKSQVEKRILVALESITTELVLDYQKKVIKEITEYGSEYYIDEETNDIYPSIFEIPQFINLFDLAFLKLNELMEAQFENVLKSKNKYHLEKAWNEYRLYIENLIEENDGKEFDFVDSWHHKVYIDWMYRQMKYAMNDIDLYEYMNRIKNKVGSDLYRYFSKDEISMLKYGGTTDKYQISDYWDEESFKDGGEVKTKKIITDKIGWNERVAHYFIEADPKLAIWLADGFMKYHLSKNLLPDNSSKESKKKYGIDISDKPTQEDWDKLSIDIKKKMINELYSDSNMFIRYGEIYESTGYVRADNQIRSILDWLKHPITPKQDLKNLSILDALEKAKQWHDELQAIGGDVDFVEPEENKKIIQYPIDDKGVEYYWVQIPKTFCSLESQRMGHCGRTGSGDSLLSLRSIRPFGKGHTINDSHVTIAYNEEQGLFYQIKGKKNAKPSEKYFPYIFDLIRNFAKEDRVLKLIKELDDLNDEYLKIKSIIEDLEPQVVELRRKNYILEQKINITKNNREYEAIKGTMDSIIDEIFILKTTITQNESIKKIIENQITNKERQINKSKGGSQYAFNGFGTEYASNEDYGWSDMSDSEIKQLYEINPQLFKGLMGELLLYQRKLSDNVPNMTFILKKDIYDLEDIIDFGRDLDPNFVKRVLSGDIRNGQFKTNKQIIDYYLNDLDDKSVEIIVDKISEITGVPKEEVSQDGIEYYLNFDYNENGFDFDSIFDRIKRAILSSENIEEENHYYKIIKQTLEELGEIIEIDDVSVKLKIDLLNLVSIDQIIKTFNEIGETNDLEQLFEVEIESGDIEKPKLRVDYRYSPIATEEGINENFQNDDYYKKGGTIKDNQEVDNHEIFNYTDIDNFDGTSFMFKDGGLLGKYAFADKYNAANKTARQLQRTKEYEVDNDYETKLLNMLSDWTYAPNNSYQIYSQRNNLNKLKKEYPSIFKPNFNGLVYRGISMLPKEIDRLNKIDLKDFEKIKFQNKIYYLYKKPIQYKPIKNVESWTISSKIASDFGKDVILVSKIDDNFYMNPKIMNSIFDGQKEDEVLHLGKDFIKKVYAMIDSSEFENLLSKVNTNRIDRVNKLKFKDGGTTDDNKETYAKWKQLVNMSYSELNRFYNSEEGKKAGLTPSQASAQGIDSGRESARWILKMKKTPKSEWTPQMWRWAKKQISFISRMSGNKGKLYDDKGRKTRKYLSLLIWGNNPEKN